MRISPAVIQSRREKGEFTVLTRPNGVWESFEVGRLTYGASGLATEVYEHREHPGSIVLLGHFTSEQVFKALWESGEAYVVTKVIGIGNSLLPFVPQWALEEQKYREMKAVMDEQDRVIEKIDKVLASNPNRLEAEKYILKNLAPKYNELNKKHSRALEGWLKAMENDAGR